MDKLLCKACCFVLLKVYPDMNTVLRTAVHLVPVQDMPPEWL